MKTASAAVINILNTASLILRADNYTFTLPDGTVLRWTSGDRDFPIGANTWVRGPVIKRSNTKQSVGINVDTLTINIEDDGTFMVNGRSLLQILQEGEFDGAMVQLDKLFLTDWNDTSPGVVPWFTGYVSEVIAETGEVELRVKDLLGMLDIPMPRALYMPPCVNTFGNAACTVSIPALTGVGTVGAGSTNKIINLSGAAVTKADHYYDLGVVKFTSGAFNKIARTIRSHAGNAATISPALPSAPATGDAIAVYPSCLKTQTACAGYTNSNNYRGFPFVPAPDTLYAGSSTPSTNTTQGGTGSAPGGGGSSYSTQESYNK